MLRSSLRGAVAAHEIVSLARERIGSGDSLYFTPEIPAKKEAAARRTHALHLPEGEPILVLYDATVFGGADDGFVFTAERLCWKNFLEGPRQIVWRDIEPAGVSADDTSVLVAGGRIVSIHSDAAAVASVIAELATRARAGDGPYRGSTEASPDTAGGALIATSRLVAIARRHVGEVDRVHYSPTIPPRKLQQVRDTHAANLPADEEIAVLYDDTCFGSAEEGFVLTTARVCWKNLAQEPAMVAWGGLEPETITSTVGNRIEVMGDGVGLTMNSELSALVGAIDLTMNPELSAKVAALLAMIAREARGRA